MKMTVSAEDRQRLPRINKAYADSAQLRAMFASRDAFVDHMLKSEWESSEKLQAEFPDAASFTGYAKWAAKQV